MTNNSPINSAAADAGKPRPVIRGEECKGCGRCIAACPKQVLRFRAGVNVRGYKVAEYVGEGCIGCCLCFYTCPEPNTIAIHNPKRPAAASRTAEPASASGTAQPLNPATPPAGNQGAVA